MMTRALLALALFASCSPDFQDGDEHFYITDKGASMPVWVTGNWRSNKIIVHVHGGPGTTNGIVIIRGAVKKKNAGKKKA